MRKYGIERFLSECAGREGYSWYLYTGMGMWSDLKGFKGTAKFMFEQAKEEMEHMEKVLEYARELGVEIDLPDIKAPSFKKGTIKDLFMQAYNHEVSVTKGIHDFYEAALKSNDHRTAIFLQWFITEQIEEEKQIKEILSIIEMCGLEPPGLFLADKAIGEMKK